MIHQLKCDSQYFKDCCEGRKTFEVRKNDRNFIVGDLIALNELTPHECNSKHEHLETGDCALFQINYILNDPEFCKDGYVVLGIRPCCVIIKGTGEHADVMTNAMKGEDDDKLREVQG